MTIRKIKQGTAAEKWEIDAVGNCGEVAFPRVVVVQEPMTLNPGILIERPLGLRAVKQTIALIEAERAKYGLSTLS
jgi:hypothetical protein